jgi:hypothetical protein
MSQYGTRRIEKHSRSRPAHDFLYSLPFLGRIAMRGAVLAGRLLLAPPAMLQPTTCIIGKFLIFLRNLVHT